MYKLTYGQEDSNIVVTVIIVIGKTRQKVLLEVHIFLLNSAENICFSFKWNTWDC